MSRVEDALILHKVGRFEGDMYAFFQRPGCWRVEWLEAYNLRMPDQNLPSIVAEIVGGVMAPAVKKGVFSKPHISFQRYLGCYLQSHFYGATLGYTYRTNVALLGKLIANSGHEEKLLGSLREMASEQIRAIPERPQDMRLGSIAFEGERLRIEKNWRDSGMSDAQVKLMSEKFKIPADTAFENLFVAVNVGIGIGVWFPELVETGFAKTDMDDQTRRSLGFDSGQTVPDLRSLESEMREKVLIFLKTRRPELVAAFQKAEATHC